MLDHNGNAEGGGSQDELGSSMILWVTEQHLSDLDANAPCDFGGHLGSGLESI